VTQDFSGDGDLVALFRAGLSDIATSGGGCCIGRDETRSSRRGSEPVRSRGWVHLTHQRWTGQRPIGGRDKGQLTGLCRLLFLGHLRRSAGVCGRTGGRRAVVADEDGRETAPAGTAGWRWSGSWGFERFERTSGRFSGV